MFSERFDLPCRWLPWRKTRDSSYVCKDSRQYSSRGLKESLVWVAGGSKIPCFRLWRETYSKRSCTFYPFWEIRCRFPKDNNRWEDSWRCEEYTIRLAWEIKEPRTWSQNKPWLSIWNQELSWWVVERGKMHSRWTVRTRDLTRFRSRQMY